LTSSAYFSRVADRIEHGDEMDGREAIRRPLPICCCIALALIAGSAHAQQRLEPDAGALGTTLSHSIGVRADSPAGSPYKRLELQDGWPLVVRQDLAPAAPGRETRMRPLVSFVQMTDVHIVDAQSPERFPYARRFGRDYATDFRNQEPLTLHVADSMVQRIDAVGAGPMTGRPFDFVVTTGDNGDGRQKNELRSFVAVLDGGTVNPDSSPGEGYIGVQDSFVLPGRSDIYDQYYHPDPPPAGLQADLFKRQYGFPGYPGMLEAATQPFEAAGLDFPWFAANGNHDGAVIGYFRAWEPQLDLYWNPVGTGNIPGFGSKMLLDLPTGMTIGQFEGCLGAPTEDCVSDVFQNTPKRSVPANPDRAQYLPSEFLDIVFDSPAKPGPIGHGFTEQNRGDGTLYYTFDMGPEVVGIMLDTVDPSGKAGGSIGSKQAKWLEAQLQSHSSRYIDEQGKLATTDNPDRLIVLFSHHNLMTMDNDTSVDGDPDPVKVLAAELEAMILRYPNVILWVNGHSHVNRVWSHRGFDQNAPLASAFWEVNTASHIDFPQQSRSIEIVDNRDGTLSIFGILLDHLAPPQTDPAKLDVLGLASISRELSRNDPDFDADFQIGAPADRNVELLIARPFDGPEGSGLIGSAN
jgi:metallophosphoesterase (TIGR03767 family)